MPTLRLRILLDSHRKRLTMLVLENQLPETVEILSSSSDTPIYRKSSRRFHGRTIYTLEVSR